MSQKTGPKRILLFAGIGAIFVAGLVVGLVFKSSKPPKPAEPVVQLPPKEMPANVMAIDLGRFDEVPVAAAWLEVHDPAKARQAITTNPWIQQVLQEPLGQGFVGSWAGFFGTRGEDVKGQFSGTVKDLMADQILSVPFRLVWFSGDAASGAPALVIPEPNAKVATAFDLLDRVATRAAFTATRCPGEPEPATAGGSQSDKPAIVISKWTLAEHSVYAATRAGRLVLGRHPITALQGACAALAPMEAKAGHDVELAVAPEALGREAQLLGQVLGLGANARLAFGIEGTQLVPRGISGPLAAPGMLAGEATSEALLKMIPADMPVTLLAQLRLPKQLDAASLKAHFTSKGKGELLPRQAALLWRPHGDDSETEVALVWPRAEDEDGLVSIFSSGGNQMLIRKSCGTLVISSSKTLADEIDAACNGRSPSMLHAAGPVVAGFKAPTSIGIGINLGKLLSALTVDGYTSSGATQKALPAEIEEARKRLEELPFMGLRGLVDDDALVPGGFRS